MRRPKPRINIGALIRATREHLGLLQVDLARLLCVSSALVSAWELGDREPRLSQLERIAEVYDMPLTVFLRMQVDEFGFLVTYEWDRYEVPLNDNNATAEEIAAAIEKELILRPMTDQDWMDYVEGRIS